MVVSLQAVHFGLPQSAEQEGLSLYIQGSSCDIGKKQKPINDLKTKSKVFIEIYNFSKEEIIMSVPLYIRLYQLSPGISQELAQHSHSNAKKT